ncbi:hypothetical protein LOZ57_003878 [Ophidiomyces ophidiicola]|uniref:uncharacterized protein n=1 Tax=Ophidiomyces ophidiicola TaxID=1387563 RepID=UPI0020C3EBDB|nr:uncharacterized protein LOZ57_003878 [Ophidiomyces ophidiicola]KAI1946126.1 hypothetical protein LOZ57_003878 [Ophidiomyces ophidiicola]KAI2050105.1 hypothetical protein LOZ43_004998 [Ophidiomyces ophidiicola]
MAPPIKRRKLTVAPVEEILFDNESRHDYLTGFHKRKVQRAKHAQEAAEKKAKDERREHRRKIREERQAELQIVLDESRKRMEELQNSSNPDDMGNSNAEDEEWEGFPEPPVIDYEAEYIDENKYTTVTVEDMDPSKEGLYKAAGNNDSDEENGHPRPTSAETKSIKKGKSTKDDRSQSKKKKKKKFRYESPMERKAARIKERMGNRKQAKARRET